MSPAQITWWNLLFRRIVLIFWRVSINSASSAMFVFGSTGKYELINKSFVVLIVNTAAWTRQKSGDMSTMMSLKMFGIAINIPFLGRPLSVSTFTAGLITRWKPGKVFLIRYALFLRTKFSWLQRIGNAEPTVWALVISLQNSCLALQKPRELYDSKQTEDIDDEEALIKDFLFKPRSVKSVVHNYWRIF